MQNARAKAEDDRAKAKKSSILYLVLVLFFPCQLFDQFPVALALRFQTNRAFCLRSRDVVKRDKQTLPGHYLQSFVCPFNHTDSIAVKILLQPQVSDFLNTIEAIEVDIL